MGQKPTVTPVSAWPKLSDLGFRGLGIAAGLLPPCDCPGFTLGTGFGWPGSVADWRPSACGLAVACVRHVYR